MKFDTTIWSFFQEKGCADRIQRSRRHCRALRLRQRATTGDSREFRRALPAKNRMNRTRWAGYSIFPPLTFSPSLVIHSGLSTKHSALFLDRHPLACSPRLDIGFFSALQSLQKSIDGCHAHREVKPCRRSAIPKPISPPPSRVLLARSSPLDRDSPDSTRIRPRSGIIRHDLLQFYPGIFSNLGLNKSSRVP